MKPLLSVEVATPENKSIKLTLVTHRQENLPQKRFFVEDAASSPFMRLAQHLTARFALGASNVCPVGEKPTCSVPTL